MGGIHTAVALQAGVRAVPAVQAAAVRGVAVGVVAVVRAVFIGVVPHPLDIQAVQAHYTPIKAASKLEKTKATPRYGLK